MSFTCHPAFLSSLPPPLESVAVFTLFERTRGAHPLPLLPPPTPFKLGYDHPKRQPVTFPLSLPPPIQSLTSLLIGPNRIKKKGTHTKTLKKRERKMLVMNHPAVVIAKSLTSSPPLTPTPAKSAPFKFQFVNGF